MATIILSSIDCSRPSICDTSASCDAFNDRERLLTPSLSSVCEYSRELYASLDMDLLPPQNCFSTCTTDKELEKGSYTLCEMRNWQMLARMRSKSFLDFATLRV